MGEGSREGALPLRKKLFDFESEMATFSAFWALAHVARGAMAPPAPLGSASGWHISKTHVQTSRNFLYRTVAVARSSSDDSAIRYVLPVLWMTSCFHIMAPMRQNQGRRYVSPNSLGGSTGDEAAVYNCLVWSCDVGLRHHAR